MIFSQLYDDQLDIELASSDLTQLFTTARRQKAVQDAQLAFVRQTRCTKKYGELSITDEEPEYNLNSLLTDYIGLAGAPSIRILDSSGNYRYIQGRDDFPRKDYEELDRLYPGWKSGSPGTPQAWYVKEDDGEELLGMTPAPDITSGDTWDLIVPYVCMPDDLSDDADEPFSLGGAPILRLRPYHQALVHYAAAVLEPLRKNYSGAQRQMQLYTGYVAQYLQQRGQDAQDQITMARNYLGEGVRSQRPVDPRRFP